MSSDVVSIENLKFSWPGSSKPVIDIEQLRVSKGQHLFIQGASGSGKTSLLNLLTAINQADAGKITMLEQSITSMNAFQRDRFRADHLGVIFQQFNLLPYLDAIGNVLLSTAFSARKQRKMKNPESEAESLLDKLQIPQTLLRKSVTELSVGQQQRVAVARALIGHPEILIADEPTSALDSNARDSFVELLFERANEYHSTVIFVSHDEQLAKHFHTRVNLAEINQSLANKPA